MALRDKLHEKLHCNSAVKALLHCEIFRSGDMVRDKLHETFHSATYPATAKIVARQVARKAGRS